MASPLMARERGEHRKATTQATSVASTRWLMLLPAAICCSTAAGATPCGVLIALDRQEQARAAGEDKPWSAVQYVERELGLPVLAIATLGDLLQYLRSGGDAALAAHAGAVQAYRDRYGV